jgi:hypothetical protein
MPAPHPPHAVAALDHRARNERCFESAELVDGAKRERFDLRERDPANRLPRFCTLGHGRMLERFER